MYILQGLVTRSTGTERTRTDKKRSEDGAGSVRAGVTSRRGRDE